jgi:hypothetical protein
MDSERVPHFVPRRYRDSFERQAASLKLEGLDICPGTQDQVMACASAIGWWRVSGRAFCDAVVARTGASIEQIEGVCTNRVACSIDHDIHFGRWDWKVCRAVLQIVHEMEIAVDWISEAYAARRMRVRVGFLRCGAEHGHLQVKHCNGVTYYLRSDLGLRRGKWHAAREPQRRPFSMRRAA